MEIKEATNVRDAVSADATAKKDLSVSLASANLRSIIFGLPPAALVFALYVLIWGRPHVSLNVSGILLIAGLFIVGVLLHEAIHGLVWALWGTKSFATIKFGMNIRALAPYAHATVPMKASAYRLGAISPALVLGLLPALAGVITGSLIALILGAIFLAAAAGDFLVLWMIRSVPANALVEDHPTRAGCIVLDADRNEPAGPLTHPSVHHQ
jgi:hypothetical protein